MKKRPATRTDLATCGGCHQNQYKSYAQMDWQRGARFEKKQATGPAPDPAYDLVLTLISDMLGDRTVVRVSQLEQRHGIGRRQVQRLFARYVGVGPKWVLARYRMHDVVTVLDEGYDGSLADLAVRYGWYDQAHFIHDFTGQVGVTPGEYRAHAADTRA